MFNPVRLITAKRDGAALPAEDIQAMVDGFTRGTIPAYQMSAFLMAAFLRGMNAEETAALTESMLYSGTVLDLSAIRGIKVDKHSTGGVGDNISLILAPIVAACGVPVPMISGRGLGHTGGTIDKLHSIPGFRTNLSTTEYLHQLETVGLVITGATDEIAPADRAIYALRDVTATVAFIPFIAASIMSKKLAEGIDALVLDVKTGKGAFMKTQPMAQQLAETLAHIGENSGKPTVAWLTRMDVPLGHAMGNWVEIEESIRCLQGEQEDDLMEIALQLAGEMLFLGGVAETPEKGKDQATQAITSGRALEKLLQVVEAQGGDPAALSRCTLPEPAGTAYAPPDCTGYVTDIDAYAIGMTVVEMGAGRLAQTDDVDPMAGIVLCRKPGDPCSSGDPIAHIYTQKTSELSRFASSIQKAYTFGNKSPQKQSLLIGRLDRRGWQF